MKDNEDHQLWKAFQSYRNVTTLEGQKQADNNGKLVQELKKLTPAKLNLPEYDVEMGRLAEGIQRHRYEFGERG